MALQSNGQEGQLRPSADFGLESGRPFLNYTALNSGPDAIYIFNILHEEFNEQGVYPVNLSKIYVEITQDAVILSKKIFPVPSGMFVEKTNVPFVTRLAPGAHVTEKMNVPEILQPASPYLPDATDDSGQKTALRKIFFELGYFVAKAGTDDLVKSYPTTLGSRLGFDPFPITSQLIKRAGPLGATEVALPDIK
jgi:hypothetical protein